LNVKRRHWLGLVCRPTVAVSLVGDINQ